ncbi:MAG TPA: response regulator [Bacteroidia bacterium]|nr:response regulator [Bacteroidia bacterium]HNC32997.1 response regulator [Bacteroidia bacterium]HNF32212.1 response regulator [Bacteroidia bacterium]
MSHILLIEDNKEVRENTAEILELAGYTVTTANDGKKGIEAVHKNRPALIICDIMMPVLEGYGVLHLLGKNPETSTIPFIFLTAKTERGDFRKGMEMGADDYITKPFDKLELLNAIESRLKKVEALKKEYSKDLEGLTNFIGEVGGKDHMQAFIENRKIRTYKKKENIYKEGDYPRGMYYINHGKVKLYKSHAYGKELITNLLKEGDFFGYTSLIEEGDYVESAQTLEDTEVVFIPKEDFLNLLFSNREIAKRFLLILNKKFNEQQDYLIELAYSSVRKRVAEALILLSDKYKANRDERFSMSISREDLANIVGTATESLIRTLSDFKEEKLIEVKDGKIVLINENKLKELKN